MRFYFFTQGSGEHYSCEIIPIEVKSVKHTKSQSLKAYMEEYKPAAVRIFMKNYGVLASNQTGKLYSVSLYMTIFSFA